MIMKMKVKRENKYKYYSKDIIKQNLNYFNTSSTHLKKTYISLKLNKIVNEFFLLNGTNIANEVRVQLSKLLSFNLK